MNLLRVVIFFFLSAAALFAQRFTDDQVQQKLLEQPPQAIVDLSNRGVRHKIDPITVTFANADLDGSGAFQYYVALYSTQSGSGGFLRVFKQQGAQLVIAGDQDIDDTGVGGYQQGIEFVDVNNDGIPEIKVTSISHDAQDQYFSLFQWTGSSLHDMVGDVVQDGALEDIDNDGIMEIVAHNIEQNNFDIYKLSGGNYRLFVTVDQDPSHLTGADGTLVLVRAFCVNLDPDHFSLEQIAKARTGKLEEAAVHLVFGGLRDLKDHAVSINDVDLSTILVGPGLRPQRISLHPSASSPKQDKSGSKQDKLGKDEPKSGKEKHEQRENLCSDNSGEITVELSRAEFLNSLQKLQPDAPLAPADKIEVRVRARMKDGTLLTTVVRAQIVDSDDKDHTTKAKAEKD